MIVLFENDCIGFYWDSSFNCVWLYITIPTLFNQSVSSRENSSLTGLANKLDNFKANIVEGTYLFFSIELMVCLDTPIFLANTSWVRLCSARSTFILLRTSKSF